MRVRVRVRVRVFIRIGGCCAAAENLCLRNFFRSLLLMLLGGDVGGGAMDVAVLAIAFAFVVGSVGAITRWSIGIDIDIFINTGVAAVAALPFKAKAKHYNESIRQTTTSNQTLIG